MKNRKDKHGDYLHLIYIPFDFIVTFGVIILSFLAEQGKLYFFSHYFGPLIYASAVSLVTVIVFAIFGVYKILTHNFGLYEAIKIILIVAVIQIIGLVVVFVTPNLPDFQRVCSCEPLFLGSQNSNFLLHLGRQPEIL